MDVDVDEKSDEAIVLMKPSNKRVEALAEMVEGRASPEGNSDQVAAVRTQSRVAASICLITVRQASFHLL